VSRLAAVTAAALLAAPAASAHGPAGGGAGYVSTVAGMQPNVLGVNVSVLGGDDRLRLANYSGKTIVVLGYDGEPFLRFAESGVYENLRSPATYLSRVRDPRQAKVPSSADGQAPARWRRVAPGGASFVWHDHRIHWTGLEPPRVVRGEPDAIHRIFRWRIPARADGEPFVVAGFLGYAPDDAAAADGEEETSAWLLAAVLVASLLGVAALVVTGVRRTRRRTPAP
jgi:hypothetical protein